MNALLIELILPSFLVTLFALGCLTAVLRKNAFQSLMGIFLMAWAPVIFLAQIGRVWGSAEASLLASVIAFTAAFTTVGGMILVEWLGNKTGTVDLDA